MGYWENRQARIMYEYMDDAEEVSQELAEIYRKASNKINHDMEHIFKNYARRHNLSEVEARVLLNKLHSKGDIKEMMAELAKNPDNADLLAELESGAYRARIERLENLQLEIDRTMKDVYSQEKKVSTRHYVDLAQNAYYRNIYEIQRKAGFQFSFSACDPKAINMMLASDWSGANYSTRIWNNTQNLGQEVKEQLLMNLLTGKNLEQASMEIANKYAKGAFEARRLVRTESNFVSGQMQRMAYEECDAEYYDFVAVLDLKTSHVCQELDGKVFKVSDMVAGVNCNPMHPFCRSTTTIHLDDEEMAGLSRRARDPVTGQNKMVPASTNYQEWYKQNVANNPEALKVKKELQNPKKAKKGIEVTATEAEIKKTKQSAAVQKSAGSNAAKAKQETSSEKSEPTANKEASNIPKDSEPKVQQSEKAFKDVLEEMTKNVNATGKVVNELDHYTWDGKTYKVDGTNVKQSNTKRELEVAEMLKNKFGVDVNLVPEISGEYEGVRTPDYLINGERWDLKELTTGTSERVLKNKVKDKKGQAENFIFDITKSKLPYEEIEKQAENLFTQFKSNEYIKRAAIIKDDEILRIIERQ